jgi:hypothetical protein
MNDLNLYDMTLRCARIHLASGSRSFSKLLIDRTVSFLTGVKCAHDVRARLAVFTFLDQIAEGFFHQSLKFTPFFFGERAHLGEYLGVD